MLTVARWLLFAVSITAVVAAAARLARHATTAGDLRFAAVCVLTAAVAVAEALLLGLVGLGGNGPVVAAAAVLTWLAVRLTVPPTGPSTTSLAFAAWRRMSALGRGALGAAGGIVLVETAYVIGRPAIGTDGLIYHLADPAIWLHDGRPGSMHPVMSSLPVQAYPKTGEVLLEWALATGRTPVATSLVIVAAAVAAAVFAWAAFRRCGVPDLVATALAVALIACPVVVSQLAGPNTDLLTLTWVLATAVLCLGAARDARLLALAVVAAGLAVGTKTTAIPIVVVVLLAALWARRRDVAGHVPALLLASATALGIGVVWYIRNLAVYGAPFYPFSRLPSGPRLPPVVTALGARFVDDPLGAIRYETPESFVRSMGGGAALAAGVVLVILLLLTVRDRRLRRILAVAALAALADTAIWAVAPFTGWSGLRGTRGLVLAGIRYLVPGFALYALVVGLAARARGPLRVVARLVAAVAIGADVWADAALGFGIRPSLPRLLAAALAGALVAVLAGTVRRTAPVPRPWVAAAGAVGVAAVVAGLSAGTSGYFERHLRVAEQAHVDEPALLRALAAQPQWARGGLPVAIGPIANAMVGGATFAHPLQVITQRTPCAAIRAAAVHGWVILPRRVQPPALPGATGYDRIQCLAGVHPRFTAEGNAVFAPGSGATG